MGGESCKEGCVVTEPHPLPGHHLGNLWADLIELHVVEQPHQRQHTLVHVEVILLQVLL